MSQKLSSSSKSNNIKLTSMYRENNFRRTRTKERDERRALVKQIFERATKKPTIPELAKRFMVSIETIRKDIRFLGLK